MKYEILAFGFVILSCLSSVIYKKIQIDPIPMSFYSSIVGFITFSIIIYYKFKKNPEIFKKKKNPYGLTDNPFKNIYNNSLSWKIGLSGVIMNLAALFALKKLPYSFVLPINMTWLFFALFFNKIMRKKDITMEKIISISIVIIGVFVIQFHHIKNFNSLNIENYKYFIFLLIILLISKMMKAYQVNVIKEVEDYVTYNDAILMDWGTLIVFNTIIYLIYLYSPIKKWTISLPQKKEILKLAITNIILLSSYVLLKFKALQNLTVTTFSLISSTNVIFAIIFGYFFFQEKLTINQFIGAIIIIFGISYKNIIKKLHNKHLHDSSAYDSH